MLQSVISRFGESNIDALLLQGAVNRRYVTGFPCEDAWLLVLRDNAYFFTDSRYIEAANANVTCANVVLWSRERPYLKQIRALLQTADVQTLGIDGDAVTYADFLNYRKVLCADGYALDIVTADGIMQELRMVKSEREKARIREAQRLTDELFLDILPLIKPGVTEKAIAAEIVYRFLRKGAEGVSFPPIVAAGATGSMPHAIPTDNTVKQGDFVTLDFGCVLDGYCSDMTRTVAVGHMSEEQREVYTVVLKAQLAGIVAARAGVTGADVHAAAAKVIADAGYEKYFGHGFGHGVGMQVHEQPNLSPSNAKPLPAGAVCSAEPGIYIPGKFGVRTEDVIIIGDGGCENITNSAK